MSSRNQKLRLIGALAALATLALAISCRGFFVAPTVTALTLSPTTPTVPLGGTLQMVAYATFNDGSTGNVSSKATWTSDSGIITVSPGGLLTGVTLGSTTATITAVDQTITQTATASVCVEGGSSFLISPLNDTVTGGTPVSYTASATAAIGGVVTEGIDITTGVVWTSNQTSLITFASGDPAVATTSTPTAQTTALITASYTCNGVTNTFTTNLTLNP
jgi:hypothetical protein